MTNQNTVSNILQYSDWTILEYENKTCTQKFHRIMVNPGHIKE